MEFSSNSLFFFMFFIFFSFVASNPSDSSFRTTYDHLCNDVVPASTTPPHVETSLDFAESLRILSGYFSGGDPIFNNSAADVIFNNYATESFSNHFTFRATSVQRTTTDDVFELQAQVFITQQKEGYAHDRSLFRVKVTQRMKVSLSGFWSQSSGKICMFGTGSYGLRNMQNVNVVLKLRYPNNVTIFDSLITGTLESFDEMKNSLNHFEPVSILALSHSSSYNFRMIGKENGNGNCVAGSNGVSLSLRNLNRGAYVGDCSIKFTLWCPAVLSLRNRSTVLGIGYGVINLLVNLATSVALDLRVAGKDQEVSLVKSNSLCSIKSNSFLDVSYKDERRECD